MGKGDKVRQVLIPAEISARLLASRGDAPASAPVFGSVRRPGEALTERVVNYLVKAAADRAGVNPAVSVHWLRHADASHAIDNGASITPCVGHPGPCRSEDDFGLRSCPSGRELGPVSQDQMEGRCPLRFLSAAEWDRCSVVTLYSWRSSALWRTRLQLSQ